MLSGRILSGEDSWICRAKAWTLHGKPSSGVPSEPCEGRQTVYLDVRRNDEWAMEHIKGAVHFELARLETGEIPDIPKDSNIQIYCRSGSRAEIARMILKNANFERVNNAGGLEELKAQGFPVE